MKNREMLRQAVMAVIKDNENRVLIGASPRDGGYKFPQGGMDPGESPLEALKREVNEELGIVLAEGDILKESSQKVRYYYPKEFNPAQHNLDGRFIGQEQTVFLIAYREDMKIEPQDEEFSEMYWIFGKDLKHYNTQHRSEAYHKALEFCGLIDNVHN